MQTPTDTLTLPKQPQVPLHALQSPDVIRTVSDKAARLTEKNSYGRSKLTEENIVGEKEAIIEAFLEHFTSLGYLKAEQVGTNSGIDPSVYFIGAPISALKPYITQERIPEEGICMHQDCIRTKNTKTIFDDSALPNWGSCFPGMAAIRRFEDRETALRDSIELLLVKMRVPLENIAINISSEDEDLIRLLKDVGSPIRLEYDTKPKVYYTHKYGLGSIVGRNFNFTLKDRYGRFNDIGNFIIIEDGAKKYGVELALGTSVIMKELFECEHVLDTSSVSKCFEADSPLFRKFQDCVMSSLLLVRSSVEVSASNTKGRILRTYLRGILYFSKKFGIDREELRRRMERYERLEYGGESGAVEYILGYLETAEHSLKEKKAPFTNEEEKLKSVIN